MKLLYSSYGAGVSQILVSNELLPWFAKQLERKDLKVELEEINITLDRFDVPEGGTITLSTYDTLSRETIVKTVAYFSSVFPGRNIVVLHSGSSLNSSD